MSMSKTDFYQSHLNRVSRSFAYCIGNLNAPLKAWVGLTYLICRVLDTVEDAPWRHDLDQQKHFDRFNDFLMKAPEKEDVEHWSARFPESIPEGERLLLQDSHKLFEDLHQSPDSVKSIIQQMVVSMSQGVKHFSHTKSENNGVLKLSSLKEVNQYCFFVAGVVGEALARLVEHVEPQFKVARHRILDAHHFGLFLQKVNLLKDQKNDAVEGREFVYDRNEILQSMSYNAHGAWRFFQNLPLQQREFRLFCAWSLFLGLASLPWLEQFNELETSGKLPREEAEEIFNGVEAMIDDPDQLDDLFGQLLAASGLSTVTDEQYLAQKSSSPATETWPSSLYHGQMEPVQAVSLGF